MNCCNSSTRNATDLRGQRRVPAGNRLNALGYVTVNLKHSPLTVTTHQQTKAEHMAKSILYMSMSLDGFITGPDDGPDNGLGIGGNRLHEWLGDPVSGLPHFDPPGLSGRVFAELMATGAVVVGRKTFDYAGHWGGDHHGVPIFVPTRGTAPAPQSGQGGGRRP
jgi:hypothetical protein